MATQASAAGAAPQASTESPSGNETVARLASKRDKWRQQAKDLEAQRDSARKEAETLKAKIAELEKSAARVTELETQIRESGHRTRFAELAREAGCEDPKAIQDLWQHSGYKAEGESPNDQAIKAAIEAQKAERKYLFARAASGQDDGDQPLIKPGPGRGQGGQDRYESGKVEVTQQQLRDPQWCYQNQGLLKKVANKIGSLPVAQVADHFAIV